MMPLWLVIAIFIAVVIIGIILYFNLREVSKLVGWKIPEVEFEEEKNKLE